MFLSVLYTCHAAVSMADDLGYEGTVEAPLVGVRIGIEFSIDVSFLKQVKVKILNVSCVQI